MNPLSKLQSEAVLELSNLEVKVYNSKYDKYENGSAIIYVNKQAEKKVKQFLSDQLAKAYKAGQENSKQLT